VIDTFANGRLFESDFDNTNKTLQLIDNSMGNRAPLDLEGLIAPGDSGGGVFIKVNGVDYLAGINSFLAAWDGTVNADYGDISGAIRVSALNPWIDRVLAAPAPTKVSTAFALDGTAISLSDSAVPEPASCALVVIGMVAGTMHRRRKEVI
jgi:hypothetical protein